MGLLRTLGLGLVRTLLYFAVLYFSGLFLLLLFPVIPLIDPFPVESIVVVSLLLLSIVGAAFGKSRLASLAFAVFCLIVASSIARGLREPFPLKIPSKGLALVTGSTSGIGASAALKLANAGWKVIITGRRQGVISEMAKSSTNFIDLGTADFFETKSVEAYASRVAAYLKESKSKLDLLILNAGLASLEKKTAEGFDGLFAVNVINPARLERRLESHMKQSTGRVVHVSSLSAASASVDLETLVDLKLTMPTDATDRPYGRTKLGQVAWAQRKSQTTTVSLHPGACASEIFDGALKKDHPPPGMPLAYWQKVVRPVLGRWWYITWFPTSFCADAVLYSSFAPEAHSGDFFVRYRISNSTFFNHPLSKDPTYVNRLIENVNKAIAA